jgi:type VI protein secretion system component Hcp
VGRRPKSEATSPRPITIGWIELSSAQFGVGRASAERTEGADRLPAVSEIVVTKVQDVASNALFKECLYGEGKKVLIDFVKDECGKPKVYIAMTLTGVLLSGCAPSNSSIGRGGPMESLSLRFTKIEYGPSTGVQPHTMPLPHQNPAFWNIRPPAR